MQIHLFREVKSFGRGDPADESETWESKVEYYIVPESDLEEFNESLVSEYESQDYSYQYNCDRIMSFDSSELELVKTALTDYIITHRR